MTKIQTRSENQSYLGWWRDFLEQVGYLVLVASIEEVLEKQRIRDEELSRWGAVLEDNILIFENDEDATLFVMRWM